MRSSRHSESDTRRQAASLAADHTPRAVSRRLGQRPSPSYLHDFIYGAIDGAPARLFFLLVAPTVTQHLAVLARISRLLRDGKLRQELAAAESPKKAMSILREGEGKL